MKITREQVGFYDDPNQPIDQPTYDPPHLGPCPICQIPMTPDDQRTISIMYGTAVEHSDRCYFYRAHRTCHEALSDQDVLALDGIAFRAVGAMP